MTDYKPYNPLDKTRLGENVADALLAQATIPLPPPSTFVGAGIYAIYYGGEFDAYAPIRFSRKGNQVPIYVGKAVPAGARKGGLGLIDDPGDVLFKRLREHAQSIEAATNLSIADFVCRFLPVDDIWIPLGEALLIERFRPLWNTVVDGFGNHDPGSGRHAQQKSIWDELHPGRSWADRLQPAPKSRAEILALIDKALGAS